MRMLLALLAVGAAVVPVAAAGAQPSWAEPQIRIVTARGLMGGDARSFAADRVLTARELADLVSDLSGKPAETSLDPSMPVTIARLDAALVNGLGLGPAATRFRDAARAAGLQPPARFGTEVVARLLGLRTDHRQDALERKPGEPATRAEAAFSAAKVLGWTGWEADYARGLSDGFAPEPVSGWQQTVLREAVSFVGLPYVWGGTSERRQEVLATAVPGGFDCSGLVIRVFTTASYAAGTRLAGTLRGRTTYELSGEIPRAARIHLTDLEPADIVFFGAKGRRSAPKEIDHAGIYLGGGWMIHSSTQGVALAALTGAYRTRFAWGRRPLAEAGLTS
jgi:cell wall-associated NlpC family hydrolase